MQGETILIIDDDPLILHLVSHILYQAGGQTYIATNGPKGLRQFQNHHPDLVILDIMMPDMDGWETCRHLRRLSPHVPLLMLTALDQDSCVIRGLQSGADDYLAKPFSAEVLVARVEALLRRAALPAVTQKAVAYRDGYLTIDLAERRVLVEGQPVKLTAKEYQLLVYLLQNSGRVLTFRQILEDVWGATYQDSIEYVHVYVSRLRQKLEREPKNPAYFLTHYGVGYFFQKLLAPPLKPPADKRTSASLRSPE